MDILSSFNPVECTCECTQDETLDDFKSSGVKVKPIAVRFDVSDQMLIKLWDWTILEYSLGVDLCREGLLDGFMLGISKLGKEYIRGIGDWGQIIIYRTYLGFN